MARYTLVYTNTFDKDTIKLVKSNPSLKIKIEVTLKKLEVNPFDGRKVEGSGYWRVWVGDGHRLFYDVDRNNVVILHLRKKEKGTYK